MIVRNGNKMCSLSQMWVTVGFIKMVKASLVLTDDSKELLWLCYLARSRFKVSMYHFFIILSVCSLEIPQGVIHGSFGNFSSELRWFIKNRMAVLKLFHGSIPLLNWPCLVSSPCCMYYPGRSCAATTSACKRTAAKELSPNIKKN